MQDAENELEQGEPEQPKGAPPGRASRTYFTRRNVALSLAIIAIFGILLALLTIVSYRTGAFDSYIKTQFVTKMAEIGMVFDADVFRVTVNPLEVELKNATFKDRLTGEKLFFIRDGHFLLSVENLYAWQLSRDLSIEKTEINGAEVWVKFDEDGRSNFSNLKLVEDQAGNRVNFKYDTVDFTLRDSLIHFGDLSRNISGSARNVLFLLSPVNPAAGDEQKRYKFDLTSTDSNFAYNENNVENIDLRASGIADRNGAEINSLELKTPIGESTLSGTLTDWASPNYNFDIQSSVDLTQASGIFANGTSLIGVGNFKGKVSGEGESYRVEGQVDTESLRAGGVSLKGVNIAATVEGTNSSYEANGNAIAQMLTFDDFRVDFLKLAGNVIGTGTDFRWIGDLQAAAAKTGSLTLGGLFLSDALAEYKDGQIRTEAGTGRAQKFSVGDTELTQLMARNLKFSRVDGVTSLSAPNAQMGSLKTKNYSLQGATGRNVRIRDAGERTDVQIEALRSGAGTIKDAKLRNVSADKFTLIDRSRTTAITATNLRAERVDSNGTRIDGLEAPSMTVDDSVGGAAVIYSDKLRVARIDTGSATLGTLNIAGVRLTIKAGRVEARSNDIDAGRATLAKTADLPGGGTLDDVTFRKPVYILEPSGRYRATADMSLGGGALGSVALGAATAKVDVNNDRVALNELTANIMEGSLNGTAVIALNRRATSTITGDFANLDVSKLLALQGGRVLPIEGETTGRVDLSFVGTNFRSANGSINADISANAGSAGSGSIPVNGQLRLSAANGLFTVDVANFKSAASELTATGRFDLKDENSDLVLALRSTDASEIDRLIRVLGVSPGLEQQLDSMEARFAGKMNFDGTITGNLTDPTINGRATLDSLSMRGREVGSIATDIFASPAGVELRDGKLTQPDGGSATFAVNIPSGGANNTSVKATLTNVNAGNLLAALPISLPVKIRDFDGQTSGTVDISGLPNNSQGEINLAAARGTIAGQAFDGLNVKAVFTGTRVELQKAEMRIGNGNLTATGNYDRGTEAFNLDLTGKTIPMPLLIAFVPNNESIPNLSGDVDFSAKATGFFDRSTTYDVTFNGVSPNAKLNETSLGQVTFKGQTVNNVLTADLTASLDGHPQVINATVNFADADLPFMVATDFNQSPIAPFLSFIPQLNGVPITGTGTGRVTLGGNLSQIDAKGDRIYTSANLSGSAEFSQLALRIQDTPLSAAEPVVIRFNTREIVFESARFAGGGSNMTISGTKALTEEGVNNLSIDGRVNLNLLNLATRDTFFAGFADASVRLSGPNSTARLSGTANVLNGSVATFLGSDRFTVDRLKAKVIFTTNQVEIEEATGYLGGGKFTGSGGGTLDGLSVKAFRFAMDGTNVTVPLPKDFITTGDARLEITGVRRDPASDLQMTISGRVFARRSLYSKDIDLANIVSGRRDPVLSGGGSSINAPRFDIVIEGRDALIVRNNIADLTASVSLALTGDANEPHVTGRITANSGTIFFRKERYVVQRGVLEFPPDTAFEPIINLQAESEIAGYQVFINLAGPLKDSELLTATVRSSPALPQADVVSLITTGSLTNTEGGIPTLAQTGINTAAEILTDAIINNPVRKATDKLFGLNVFEIDPLVSGQQLNPSARLTVGRQINNRLRVTYSTNLSQDQNQVLAVEYRVSNKLSFVAQYEQRSLSNVTRNRDNFSFEVRFRKRF
ncbi:MAG: translocation/assembly module TamB domain-containing protein [Pyrinomonadaceae bacterium]